MTDQKTISLAQWCAYLPYGIEIKHERFERAAKLTAAKIENIISSPEFAAKIKPLLRPMNEANKAHINELMQTTTNTVYRFYPNYGFSDITDTSDEFYFSYECLPYDIVQKLLAAHYDIYNLIPQGLALPIE
jgi:hypothetical protein